jgi:hypothetical protein
MLTVGQEGSPLIEINGGSDIRAVAFAANGKYLITGGGGDGGGEWKTANKWQQCIIKCRFRSRLSEGGISHRRSIF